MLFYPQGYISIISLTFSSSCPSLWWPCFHSLICGIQCSLVSPSFMISSACWSHICSFGKSSCISPSKTGKTLCQRKPWSTKCRVKGCLYHSLSCSGSEITLQTCARALNWNTRWAVERAVMEERLAVLIGCKTQRKNSTSLILSGYSICLLFFS